jgi:hypothetical protein
MVFIDIVSSDVGEQNPNINRPITLHILLPVPMVGHAIASILGELLCHWSNPNGCKSPFPGYSPTGSQVSIWILNGGSDAYLIDNTLPSATAIGLTRLLVYKLKIQG